MSKKQWIAVALAVIILGALGFLGVWQINKTNERLLALQERSGDGWDRPQATPEPEPTPKPTLEPTAQPPKTSDFADVRPDAYVTRAMFTTMLAKLDGVETPSQDASSFGDVPTGQWYTAAVEWAARTGIVSGIGGGLFAPNEPISREQAAVMLCNYLRYKGRVYLPEETPEITDADDIGGWALASVDEVRIAGLIPDRPGSRFDPKGKVTNSEADAIFSRLMTFLQEIPRNYPGGNDLDDYGDWLPEYEHPESSPLPVYRDETLIIPNN